MSSKARLIFLVLSILTYQKSVAQNSPEKIVNKFFELYKENGSDMAIDYLFGTNKYSKGNQDAIDQLKSKLKDVLAIDGPFWGYDLLWKKMAGENFIMLTFLVKHDRDPLTFRIIFYKPHNEWQVQNFKFDNKMDEELEEASKAFRFKDSIK